ncbi:hypothetical protein CBR_g22312 [Chara braunii]|uniref:Uncharacterized protein n=1 Tax=Chara braunii TaxID=69332 RepID=A0A388L2L1_CHABU|nr:hypothetical protein CBR_g22312 [Chara braunii]|eukprot:GBG76564.1 hypothetical protein CBR_g22312 [Chara braunii]
MHHNVEERLPGSPCLQIGRERSASLNRKTLSLDRCHGDQSSQLLPCHQSSNAPRNRIIKNWILELMDLDSLCLKRHHSCVGTSTAMEEQKVKRQGRQHSVVIRDDESGICSSMGTVSSRQQTHWMKSEGSVAVGQRSRFLCALSLPHLLFVTAAAAALTLSHFAAPVAAQSFQVTLLPANNTQQLQWIADIAFSPVNGSSPPTYQFCFRVRDWTSPETVTMITLRYGQIQQYVLRRASVLQIEASSPSVTDNQLEACNASVSKPTYDEVQERIKQGSIFAVVHTGDNYQDYVLGVLKTVEKVPPFPPASATPAAIPSVPMSTAMAVGSNPASPAPSGTPSGIPPGTPLGTTSGTSTVPTQNAAAATGGTGTENSSALSWAQGAHTWSLRLAAVLLSLSVTAAAS